MTLTHEQFFALAIDPDEPPDVSLMPAIEEHRRTCAPCRELEDDYAQLLEFGRSIPGDLPPESPETEERIMSAVREIITARDRNAEHGDAEVESHPELARPSCSRLGPALLRVASFAAVAFVSLGTGIGLDRTELVGQVARGTSNSPRPKTTPDEPGGFASNWTLRPVTGEPDSLPTHALGSDDIPVARYLEKHGFHGQAKVLAQHALDEGHLAPPEIAAAKAIVGK
ncbi:MAG TPA: hypothetical protein VFF73_40325 [Planctomycetota bacterium]|nr:hypothetical protein [Planctomycetota bacterium]